MIPVVIPLLFHVGIARAYHITNGIADNIRIKRRMNALLFFS
jgi:hypothetical protein